MEPPTPPALPMIEGRIPLARVGFVVALLAIVLCVVSVVLHNGITADAAKLEPTTRNLGMEIAARYFFGIRSLLTKTGQWGPAVANDLVKSLRTMATTPIDRFRAEIIIGVLQDHSPAKTEPGGDSNGAVVNRSPELKKDVEALHHLQSQGRTAPENEWRWFHERHGWIARLARVQALPKDDAEWGRLETEAVRTAAVFGGGLMALFMATVTGFVLAIVFAVKRLKGALPSVLERPSVKWSGAFVEGFAIYLSGWVLVPALAALLFPAIPRWAFYLTGVCGVLIALFWPRWRGVDVKTWKGMVGLNMGKGLFIEIGMGIVGWICALPLMALGMIAAMQIAKHTGAPPTHPILEQFTTPGIAQWSAVLLATAWAPLVEETMFRGLLFPGLSGFSRWIIGALGGAFIFAVIHPQGWAGVPVIMVIAMMASALRVLRGSLVAPMAAHALNNGCVALLYVLGMS